MNYIKNKNGIALIMVLLMLVVVGGLSGTLLMAYNNNIHQSSNQAEQTKEFYAAESAANIIDQIVEKFNYEEGNLGMHTDYHYKQRLNDLEEEINDFIDSNDINLSQYDYEFNITEKNMDKYYLLIEVDAVNKNTNSIEETIEIKYNVKTSGYGGFFAHTLAANEIKIKDNAFNMVENLLFDDWEQISDNKRVRSFKSDLLEDIPRLATGESMNSDLGNHKFVVRQERELIEEEVWVEDDHNDSFDFSDFDSWQDFIDFIESIFKPGSSENEGHYETVTTWGEWKNVETANLKEVIEFYGEDGNDKNLYLPETENTEDFTDYVETVNFVEVLKQNNINLTFDENGISVPVEDMNTDDLFEKFKEEREESGSDEFDFGSFLDKYDQNYDLDKNNLSDYLVGYYDDIDDLKNDSDNNNYDNLGPYIYVNKFHFRVNTNNNAIDFTNFKDVNDVVHLYINDDIDFSNKNKNLYFKSSFNKKSVLVQSGGSKIDLDNKRILYYSNSKMKGIAYYAPNATMYMKGKMPGTGWGQSYNVNKIVMEEDVTFPSFEYDPEESGFIGNIHSDIKDYLGGEDEVEDYSAGEINRTRWRLVR